MKTIALSGVCNSGKTTVLKQLISVLVNMGGNVLVRKTKAQDEQCAIAYKKKIICVCTGGDTEDVVKDNFVFFATNNSDVAITACRSVASADSVCEVMKGANPQYPYYVGKMREDRMRRNAVDTQTVQQLIAMI